MRNKSDYYRLLLENSKDALFRINAKTLKFEYISPYAAELTGFTPAQLAQMGIDGVKKRLHPDSTWLANEADGIFAGRIMPPGNPAHLEFQFRHKAGHYVWLGVSRSIVSDRSGKIVSIIGSGRNITETKILQQKLKTTLDNYRTLYDNARVALFRTRISDGKVLECNESMARIMGYKSKQQCIEEAYTTNYTAPQDRREVINLLKEKGQVNNFELKTRRKNLETLWIKVSARIYPEKDYLEGALWDITPSKILTPAENEILKLIMQGKGNKEIAYLLKRSIRTIEDHRANIMRKLQVRNLVELVKKAVESGAGQAKK